MNRLGATFTRTELDESLRRAAHETQRHNEDVKRAIECLHWLVNSNYELNFSLSTPLSQRVIFPVSLNESNGMEDARFVRFVDEDAPRPITQPIPHTTGASSVHSSLKQTISFTFVSVP
jgi:hypothetical protein